MKQILIIIACILTLSACNQTKQKEAINEQPQIFITYKQPVNGYRVKVGCVSDGMEWNTASFYLNDTCRFIVEGWVDGRLFETSLKQDTVIDYIPKLADETYLSIKSPFFFSDVDFDGKDEFLVNLYRYGTYGSNLYAVYEPEQDFRLKTEVPFTELMSEQCVFDEQTKSITLAGKDDTLIDEFTTNMGINL